MAEPATNDLNDDMLVAELVIYPEHEAVAIIFDDEAHVLAVQKLRRILARAIEDDSE